MFVRATALALLLLATPLAAAQNGSSMHTTLDLVVHDDHSESLELRFEGLKGATQYQGICLPARARETRVYDALGDVPYEAKTEDDRRVISFLARQASVHVDMTRPALASTDAPLHAGDVNFCVPQQSSVTVNVAVPDDHVLFFMGDAATFTGPTRGTTSSAGPSHVFYSYEAPLPPGMQVFDEGAFRVFARDALAEAAQEMANLAASPYDAALAEAGLPRPFAQLRVLFVKETPYDWEAGHYNGRGYVSVKESALEEDPSAGYPYVGVKVLVHEAFHAASFPFGQGGVTDKTSWFLEGTARHAERKVDEAMPNGTIHCEQTRAERKCWSFDDRLSREQLDAGYHSSFTFDPRWEPSLPQTEDTRRFYYAFSEYVIASWIAQRGERAYVALWDEVLPAFQSGKDCDCGDGWLVGLMRADDLFRPWDDVRTNDPAGFEARVQPFLKDDQRLTDAVQAGRGPLGDLGIPLPLGALFAGVVGAVLLSHGRRRAMR